MLELFVVRLILGVILTLLGIRTIAYYYVRRKWGKIDRNKEESVDGKIVIITGANSGIGKVTAQELAARGATVILACRDSTAAAKTLCDIRKITQNGNLIVMKLNLASFKSIRKFASNFEKRFNELHILINNAGVLTPTRYQQKTVDGHEINFGTNYLGHYLLTNLLLDQLKAGAPSRVITVTSRIHVKGEIDFEDLMGDHKNYQDDLTKIEFPHYANSKLANAYFSQELGRRLAGTGVTTYALCPGDVYTNIGRTLDIPLAGRILYSLVSFIHKTAEEGAQTNLYCALSRDLRSQTGQMYRDCYYWKPSDRIPLDDSTAEKLWAVTEKLVSLTK